MRGFENILKIPELRKKIFYTFLLLAVYRIGGHIPVPGIDGSVHAPVAVAQGRIEPDTFGA